MNESNSSSVFEPTYRFTVATSVLGGEDRNFSGNIDFLSERSVEVMLLNDRVCIELMSKLIAERPELWYEDISGNE